MADPTLDTLFKLGLPQLPEKSKVENYQDVLDAYNAIRNLMQQVAIQTTLIQVPTGYRTTDLAAFTAGFARSRIYAPASVAIAFGQMVNFWNDSGTLRVRLADATDNTKPAHGIGNTEGGVVIGEMVEVVMPPAYMISVSGLTRGVMYYLSTTPGAVQNAPPASSGNLIQAVGVAIAPVGMYMNLSYQTQVVP